MYKKCFKLKFIALLWLFYVDTVRSNEACWNTENECNIKTELFKSMELANGISMQIDCRLDYLKFTENDSQPAAKNLLMPRFIGVQSLILDGCQTPLNAPTFGLELLPVCDNISKVSVRYFHMDTLKPLYCSANSRQLQLEYLNIQFNEIAFIDQDSFPSSYSQLRDVLVENNLLKVIHKDAFKWMRSLANLYIVDEPALMLKFPDLFEFSSVSNVHLESLKQMTSAIFNHLPETLQNLYVANTRLDNDDVLVINALALRNLTIKNCSLEKFSLRDVHSTVKRIDLSGNVMKIFTAYENNVNELNLSNNQLEWLPFKWWENLTNLESLVLKQNKIKTLSLDKLLQSVPSGQTFDLSQNCLQYLQGYETNIQDVKFSQVRLRSDQNPWDCLWLHEFAHYHPEKFRVLQYEKFISKINVNGLECVPAEKPLISAKTPKFEPSMIPEKLVNVTAYTLLYGNPWEFKRNQRAEALIIVFMLPLGIALLFVLLYMWIYCQKMFHLSYYQNFPCMRSTANHAAQRFDIVRQLPTRSHQTEPRTPLTRLTDENGEEYEIPITGLISECNCMMQHSEEPVECQKATHITYEHLPSEEAPHQIYEEIIQVGDYDGHIGSLSAKAKADNTKQTYDHLSFE